MAGGHSVRAALRHPVGEATDRDGMPLRDVSLALAAGLASGRRMEPPACRGEIGLSRACLDKAPVSARKGAGQRSAPRGPRSSRYQTPPRHRRLRHAVRLLRERGQPTRRCVMAANPVSASRPMRSTAPTSRTPAKPTIPGPSVRVIRRAGCALDRSRHDTLAQIPGQR